MLNFESEQNVAKVGNYIIIYIFLNYLLARYENLF